MTSSPRVRIAPSPTGDPHVGTAYVALFNRTFAGAHGGSMVLRIDDTDRTRYDAGSEKAIFRALEWLGITWNEGPDKGGPHAPYRQSERTQFYRDAVDALLAEGAAYRCFKTPDQLAREREARMAAGGIGFDRSSRDITPDAIEERLAAGDPFVVRLKVPLDRETTTFRDELRGEITIKNSEIDDQVLMKSDGFPTYHLANCVDDSRMGITHVVRAEEWITSTPKHVLIYEALGEPLPQFFHVPLLRNKDKSKISKRKNPVSLDWYREEGFLPEAMRNFLANLGWTAPNGEDHFDDAYFVEHFRLEDIIVGGPVFDLEKLEWLNGVHIRALDPDDLRQRLESEGFLSGVPTAEVAKIFPIVAERMHRLSDFAELTRWFFGEPDEYEPELLLFKKATLDDTVVVLEGAREVLSNQDDWSVSALATALDTHLAAAGLKKPQLFMPLRVALTGRKDSPSVDEVLSVLGRDRSIARITSAIDRVKS